MKKKYTLQCVNYQIKSHYQKAYNLIKSNYLQSKTSNTDYKRIIFKHLKMVCLKDSNYYKQKTLILNYFLRSLRLKQFYNNRLNDLDQKKLMKHNRCKVLGYQFHSYYRQFIKNVSFLSSNTILKTQYNIFFVKRTYIQFFKMVCKHISSKTKRIKKYQDATEIYLFNLLIRTLQHLRLNVSLSQADQHKLIRKTVIMRVYYKNIKQIIIEQRNRSLYYRIIHLKKYYLRRLYRTTKGINSDRIARLKFVGKWIMNWKEMVMYNKRTRAEGVVKITKELERIRIRKIVRCLKHFYSRFKEKNREMLIATIHGIKCKQLISNHLTRMKYYMLHELRYYKILNKHLRKKRFCLLKNILHILKFMKDTSIPMYLKEEEAVNKYNKRLYEKILRPFLIRGKKTIAIHKNKVAYFRYTMLKIKALKTITMFKVINTKENNRRVARFKRYFLMYNAMQMLKKHSLIMYRENRIIAGITRLLTRSRHRYKYWGLRSIRNNLLVKRNRRKKMFKLIIQVFTLMKMVLAHGSYIVNECTNEYFDYNEHY